MMIKEMSKRLRGTKVSCFPVAPGAVNTGQGGNLAWLWHPLLELFCRDVWTGSQTVLYCALQEGIENASGSLFHNCQVHALPKLARHDDSVKDLYEATLKVIPENFFQLKEVGNL